MFVLKLFSRNGLWGMYFNAHVISIQLTALKFCYTMLNKSISGHEKRSHLRLLIAELQVFFFLRSIIFFFFSFPKEFGLLHCVRNEAAALGLCAVNFEATARFFLSSTGFRPIGTKRGKKRNKQKDFGDTDISCKRERGKDGRITVYKKP